MQWDVWFAVGGERGLPAAHGGGGGGETGGCGEGVAQAVCAWLKTFPFACLLPSPASGGEGRRTSSTMPRHFVEIPALSPTPLPLAGEGSLCQPRWH
ncbi:hypothetical protein CBM2629_B130031 [Cupriavidus taiwanensis]|nr:hypothetical protein CBM2629_B130031 [Cupriavidus taiwanensis]